MKDKICTVCGTTMGFNNYFNQYVCQHCGYSEYPDVKKCPICNSRMVLTPSTGTYFCFNCENSYSDKGLQNIDQMFELIRKEINSILVRMNE